MRDLSCILPQPILQYASAFDDELQEAHEEPVEEMAAQSVPEVAEEMPERAVEDKPVEETPQTSQAAHHGPYYYFYQGVCVSLFVMMLKVNFLAIFTQ